MEREGRRPSHESRSVAGVALMEVQQGAVAVPDALRLRTLPLQFRLLRSITTVLCSRVFRKSFCEGKAVAQVVTNPPNHCCWRRIIRVARDAGWNSRRAHI